MKMKSDGGMAADFWWETAYDRWLKSQDVPVHTGHYVQDLRTLERGWWSLRGCPGAVLNLTGHQGVTEAHVLEIPPGQTIPPFRMALEEVIYVAEGQGLTSVWAEGHPKVTFEWQKHSLFRIPTNYFYQLSNARGDRPALTVHVSYLPMAMSTNANADYFFNDPYVDTSELYGGDSSFYSAQAVQRQIKRPGGTTTSTQWYANFFPDLTVWDRLTAYKKAGRLAYSGGVRFPNSAIRTGLMCLPSRRYRTAHRHGPGVTIVGIQEAQGFVIMWPEGGDYVVAPWQEGSVFVPPNQWYHMHVNSGVRREQAAADLPAAAPDELHRSGPEEVHSVCRGRPLDPEKVRRRASEERTHLLDAGRGLHGPGLCVGRGLVEGGLNPDSAVKPTGP